ncbi:MAG: UDP-glucose/GDP-mannose dehydrogenase family protein [Candidatus Micrarchaeota archaeon]|nr:UDP-glucose/GDP-mannose dehydrogenase family protein [Candidatus Micrarchaeota archaeon]
MGETVQDNDIVAVIGLWHLGSVTAACLASHGYKVVGVDQSAELATNLSNGVPPVYEPGLSEMVKEYLAKGSLEFKNDIPSAVAEAKYVILAFDTPVKEDDSTDLSPIMSSVADLIPVLRDGALLIVSSQVPVGTCEEIAARVRKARPSLDFGVACVPENLKLGEAISRFNSPDLLVMGTSSEREFKEVERLYSFADSPKLNVSLRTAEMVKHALNSFLACEVSYANELGNLCDSFGVDFVEVSKALRLDKRIGNGALLTPGLGFSGGTLGRDVKALQELGKRTGASTMLLDSILEINKRQNMMVTKKLEAAIGQINGMKIGVLGLTYKPGTSAIRRSASIEIIKGLIERGATVSAYDPKADLNGTAFGSRFERCKRAEEAAESSDAILLLTGWPEFREIDFMRIKAKMRKPVVIDAMNMLDGAKLNSMGFTYSGIGRGDPEMKK